MNPMPFDFQKQPGQLRTRFYAPDPKDALVSIVTPFYNAGRYFEQTFISLINQTFPWFEWIIVNDGSPREEDVALLLHFAAQDPRITVIHQENGGPSKARNTAVAHAKTDLIVPLDADDLLDPTYLECLYWSLQFRPDAAWSFTNSFGFQEMEYIWHPDFDAKTMKTRNLLPLTSMIRKQDFLDIGGLKIESVPYHEDWRLWLDLLSAGKKPVHIASHLFWYRRLNTGRSSGVNGNRKLARLSDQIIHKAASTVDESVQAVAFPLPGIKIACCAPEFFPWSRKTDPDHPDKRILWLISAMDNTDVLQHMAALKQQGYANFVLATSTADLSRRQAFETITDELFCLPEFLDPSHFPTFVSSYIQSREIDAVLLSGSREGYFMLPWLRRHFPDLPIGDYPCSEAYTENTFPLGSIPEKTYLPGDPAPDLQALLCQDALTRRKEFSLALQQNAPMTDAFYITGLHLYQQTYTPAQDTTPRSLPGKVLYTLREEGLHGLTARTAAWLKRKKEALLRRLHL